MSGEYRDRLAAISYSPGVEERYPEIAPLLARARQRNLPVKARNSPPTFEKFQDEKKHLYIHGERKSLLKKWKSHPRVIGADEWCLVPVQGCPMDCCYCYLQSYLERPVVQLWPGWTKLAEEIAEKIESEGSNLNFSLGEFSDGLFLEPLLEFIPYVWEIFRGTTARLEIRTKSSHIRPVLDNLNPHDRGVFCWTLTPPELARRVELFSAPVKNRLEGMKALLEAGYNVAVRFDPIFLVENWFSCYRYLLQEMKDYFSPAELEYVMLGTFRFPAGFDRIMQKRFSGLNCLRDEMVRCPDGKYRYFRNRRTEAYRRLNGLFSDYATEIKLCMEFSYIWEDVGL